MLLTLSAICLRSMLLPGRTGKIKLDLLDLPRFAREELGMHGLNLATSLLAGVGRDSLERLRDRADKAGCACLLLIESETQPFGDPSESNGAAAIERLQRVIQAGHFLGCSCIAVKIAAPVNDANAFQRTVDRLKRAVERAERLETNVLISPTDGLTATPEKVTELIKRVGGFRVGTFPDFQAASNAPDPVAYIRRLTPYAAAVCAATHKFVEDKSNGECQHTSYDIEPLLKAVVSVGYDGTLAVEYRGTGDAKLGVTRSRELLEKLLIVEPRISAVEQIVPVVEGAGDEPEEAPDDAE